MSPTNKDTADLIRRIRGGIGYIPQQAAMPNGGVNGNRVASYRVGYDPSALAKQTQEGNDLLAQVAQGGMNIFGQTMRVISGLGRGATNLAAGVLPHANNIWDTYKDGFQPSDLTTTATEALKGIGDGAWGALKGIAVSGVPASADAIQKIDGRPIYEWGSDFFKSQDFSHAMSNLKNSPVNYVLPKNLLSDLESLKNPEDASKPFFGGFSITGTPIQGFMALNRAEAYGLGWDILVDPTTYATMGIAGAAKGAFRGTSAVVKYNKLGKPANFAEVAPKALPRPYYATSKKANKIPLATPKYTVANTSAITYILKEMGRGFMESHLSRLNHIASKTTTMQAVHEYNRSIAQDVLGKEGVTPQYVEELAAANLSRALENQRAALMGQGITDPAEIERIVGETEAVLTDQAKTLAEKAPQLIAALSSKEAAANIQRIAAENGIDVVEASAMEIANQTARGLRRTTRAIPKTKSARFNTDHAFGFGRAMENASDPKNLTGDFGQIWRAFVDNASAKTLKDVFESMVMPIGYRVTAREKAAAKEAAALTETQDIVTAMHSENRLTVTGSKNRMPELDMVAQDVHIKGTNKTRRVWESKNSAELKHLMRQERLARETRTGAGSRLTKGRKPIATAKEISDTPLDFLTNLTKNYYEDVVRKTIPDTKPWDELFVNEKAIYTMQILEDPTLITADIFNKSLRNPTILAARVNYLAERELSQRSKDYDAIKTWQDNAYNPLTVEMAAPQLHEFAFDATDKSSEKAVFLAEVITLMNKAAGRIQDPVVNKILRKLNVTRATLHGADGLVDPGKIEEVLHDAHVAVMSKKRDQFLARLQLENPGDLGAVALVDPALLNADREALLGQHIADLKLKGAIATEEEIKLAVEKLSALQEEQIAAKEALSKLNIDPIGKGSPAFGILTRFEKPGAAKTSNTEQKLLQALQDAVARPATTAANLTPQQAFGEIIVKLEKLASLPTLSATIKAGIEEILTGKIGIKKLNLLPLDNQTLNSYFARIGDVVRQVEDRVKIGSTKGYDAIFTRRGGEYDVQAIPAFLEQAYRASRSQDSLDGGYFAEQIDQLLSKNSIKPLSEQTPDEIKKSLQSLSTWRGEGISAGLLHTLIRFTEKQSGKVKVTPLSDAAKEDIARAEKALYDDLIDGLLESEKANITVELKQSPYVTTDPGYGNMKRVIVEELSAAEKAQYELIRDARTVPFSEGIKEDLLKLQGAIKTAAGKGYQIGLKSPRVLRDGKDIGQIPIEKMLPGDEIKYEDILKLSLQLDKIVDKKDVVLALWQAAKQLSQKAIRISEMKAKTIIERSRAESLASKFFPAFAQKHRMIAIAEKIADPAKANANWRARTWLATLLNEGDKELRRLEQLDPNLARLRKLDSKKISVIKKEKEQFTKILRALRAKYAAQGYKATPMSKLADKDINEVIGMNNPIDFLHKMATLKVSTEEEKLAWDTAMNHLLNLPIEGKAGRYGSFTELAQTYKTASRTAKPGDTNPVTNQQIPTEQEVLQVLMSFGGNISEKAKEYLAKPEVKRASVVSLLRKLDQQITKAELDEAKSGDFLSKAHVAGENQIRNIMGTLPESNILQSEMINQMALERVKLHDEGLGWLEVIVADSLGKQYKQFILDRFEHLKIEEEYAFGKIDVDKPAPDFDRTAAKKSFETTAPGLTGWSRIVSGLSEMAKAKGLAEGSIERMQFMTEMSVRALRLQEMHLAISGIFPSISWKLKTREHIIAGLKAFTPEEVAGISKPVYLTNADILDIFPPDMIGNMLFVGRADSMPITSFAPAAKLVVSAMDALRPGTYFDEAQLSGLMSKMADLMRNDMKNSRVISGKKGPSHYDLNAQEFEANIRTVVRWMVEPQNATKLWDQHAMNGAYAMKIYQYKSGQVTKPILEALLKMFANPFTATGSKIEAVVKASEELRKLTGRGDITEEVLFQAELDLNAVLAAHIDLDSFHVAQEALKMEAAANTAEGRAILASQRKAAKGDYMQRINAIRLETEAARGEMYLNIAGLRNLKEVQQAPEIAKTDPMDVFGEHNLAEVQINRALQFGDWAISRFSYDYGMQKLRSLFDPVERRRVDDVSFFERIGANMKVQWDNQFPDRNILGEAWQIIQRIPDEILDKALQARELLRQEKINVSKTGKKTLTPDQYAALKNDSKAIDNVLNLDDTALNEAVSQLWSFGGRIFAGGEKSLVKRLGLTPSWLNKHLYEVGGPTVKAAIDNGVYKKIKDGYLFTSAKSMTDIWREWEIVNPIEMIVTMNMALQKAQLIPKIADDAVKKWGISKDLYKSAADARKDGLVEIKPIDSPTQGKELVYFMDTTNYYFPVEIAHELATFSKFVGEVNHIQTGKAEKLLKKWASFTNFTKSMMTIFRPGNYVQNSAGIVWTNAFAGVMSPFAYARGVKVMQASGRKVEEIDTNALETAMAEYEARKGAEGFIIKSVNDPRKTNTQLIVIKGKAYPFEDADIEKLATRHGLRVPVAQNREMDLIGDIGGATTIKQLKTIFQKAAAKYNKAAYWAGNAAAVRDDYGRMTLFVEELSKHNWNSLEEGAREVMKKVDRYHPQVQGLSSSLQKLRPYLMFITWRTKMMGTIAGDLLEKPGPMLTAIRAQQASANSSEQTRTRSFGDMTPTSVALPSFYKHNLDPISVDPTTGLMNKYSVANPVTDLFGSNGLLSAIDFNSYEPIQDQIGSLTMDTIDKFTFQSYPYILKAVINYPQGKLANGGQAFGTNGYSSWKDDPLLINDIMTGAGLNPLHTVAAYVFPWLAVGKMDTMTPEQRLNEGARVGLNFLTGTKSTPIDTLVNRQKGVQEILDKLKTIQQRP